MDSSFVPPTLIRIFDDSGFKDSLTTLLLILNDMFCLRKNNTQLYVLLKKKTIQYSMIWVNGSSEAFLKGSVLFILFYF